jgi:hypothetical protein
MFEHLSVVGPKVDLINTSSFVASGKLLTLFQAIGPNLQRPDVRGLLLGKQPVRYMFCRGKSAIMNMVSPR